MNAIYNIRNFKKFHEIQTGKEIKQNNKEYELLYTAENRNYIWSGQITTCIHGAICLIAAPLILFYPFDLSEGFEWIAQSYLFRGTLSTISVAVGVLVPRYFDLITRDHVLKMYFCKKTNNVKFETNSTFARTYIYETNIKNIQQIDKNIAFGPNNIICKESNKQFFIDPAYLDDDMLQMMGFLDDSYNDDDIEQFDINNNKEKIESNDSNKILK